MKNFGKLGVETVRNENEVQPMTYVRAAKKAAELIASIDDFIGERLHTPADQRMLRRFEEDIQQMLRDNKIELKPLADGGDVFEAFIKEIQNRPAEHLE
jgi:hypothetical protein